MNRSQRTNAGALAARRDAAARGRRPTALVAALVTTVMLVLAACGQTPSITLSLDAASAELLRGSDVQVEVTLTRLGGATADVALAVTGLPANVTANFSPATLIGGTLISTLTLSADPAAVEGDYAVTVTGTGTGLTATVPLSLEVVSLTVTGRVVALFESPVSGALVASQGESGVTDANGEFTLSGLSVPYDLSVWSTADNWVHVYEELTADDLRLAPIASLLTFSGFTRSADITGTLSGGVTPVPAGQPVKVCVEGLDGVAMGCGTVTAGGSYAVAAEWSGPATRQVRLHALQVELDGDNYPVSYPGYATMDLTVTDTMPSAVNLDLGSALATSTVDVTIDTPVTIANVFANVEFGPSFEMPVAVLNTAVTAHEFVMPVIDDASYGFFAFSGTLQAGWVSDVTSSAATVVVANGPTLVSPIDTATNVTNSTVFTSVNPTDGPQTFVWMLAGGPFVALTTMATTSAIPDLAEYGLTFPAASSSNWQVLGSSGPSAEQGTASFADLYNGILAMVYGASPGSFGNGTVAISDTRAFTTAP